MRKITIIILVLLLCSCTKKIDNPINEIIMDVNGYNELVIMAADENFENYYFIDLRPNSEYKNGYVSNFYPQNHIVYEDLSTVDEIIKHINKTNKAGYTCGIVLLDSGLLNDNSSTIVYEELIKRGYLNVKDIMVGYIGLYSGYEDGFPYIIRDGSDCDCQ